MPRLSLPPAAARLAAAAGLSLLLAACAEPGGAFRIASAPGNGAPLVIDAGGAAIAVTPPEGFCIDGDAVRPEGRAAFVLIEDCALLGAPVAGEGAADLPPPRPAVINGIVTLSIGDAPLFSGGEDRAVAFAGLETFLRSDQGRATVGMGGDAASISILEARRTPDTLYLLIEDRGEQVLPVLGDRFWRGFTEVKDRAIIASLGVFDAATPMRDERKLAHLARVVSAIKRGNGDAVPEAELRLAADAPAPRRPAPAEATAEAPAEPALAALGPVPAPRPDPGGAPAPAPGPRPAAAPAPGGTPQAPARTPLPAPRA